MKSVAKYNIFKGISTLLTVGTPVVTLACCGDFIVHRTDTAFSTAGVIAIIFSAYMLKDKIAENFKPPLWAACLIGIVIIEIIKSIIMPVEIVLITTAAATGLDTVTFDKFCKQMYKHFPESTEEKTHFGFIFTHTKTLLEQNEVELNGTK